MQGVICGALAILNPCAQILGTLHDTNLRQRPARKVLGSTF